MTGQRCTVTTTFFHYHGGTSPFAKRLRNMLRSLLRSPGPAPELAPEPLCCIELASELAQEEPAPTCSRTCSQICSGLAGLLQNLLQTPASEPARSVPRTLPGICLGTYSRFPLGLAATSERAQKGKRSRILSREGREWALRHCPTQVGHRVPYWVPNHVRC